MRPKKPMKRRRRGELPRRRPTAYGATSAVRPTESESEEEEEEQEEEEEKRGWQQRRTPGSAQNRSPYLLATSSSTQRLRLPFSHSPFLQTPSAE